MAGKKLNKAEQEKAEADAAALEQQQREQAAALAKQQQLDAIFTPNPTLHVPQHDDALIQPTLERQFFLLYHPTPAPIPSPVQPLPPVEEQKEVVVTKGKAASAKGKVSTKKTAVVEGPPPPPPEPIAPPPPPPLAADHPLSVLKERWRAHELYFNEMEAALLTISTSRAERRRHHDTEVQLAHHLIPNVDSPMREPFPFSSLSPSLSSKGLIDLSLVVFNAVERGSAGRRAIVRAMPKIVKRPSTRTSRANDDNEEEEKDKRGSARSSKTRTMKPLTDKQRVSRELNAIAMSPVELSASQQLLHRLQQKRNFLLNPRHRDTKERRLVADVEAVKWERWEVGEEYERTIRITNVSSTTHRVAIHQPKPITPFAISALFPPSSSPPSTVAPGLCLTLTITFKPTSLTSLTDVVSVSTSSSSSLSIPLYAHRVPTVLTLPSDITVPATLLSRTSIVRLPVHNLGLSSSFRVLTRHEFDTNDQPKSSTVNCGPFSLYPREFELDENDSLVVTLTFSPDLAHTTSASEVRSMTDGVDGSIFTFDEELCVVSDDGMVSRHRVKGEASDMALRCLLPVQSKTQALVKPRPPFLFAIEQRSSSPTASSLISFPLTTVGFSSTLCLVLSNPTPCALPYQWLLPFNDSFSSLTPIFHLYPPSGTLQGHEQREVVLTFTPKAGESYAHWAQLIINGEEGKGEGDVSVAEVRMEGEGRMGRLEMSEVVEDDQQGAGQWRLITGEWGERKVRVSNPCEVELEYVVQCEGVDERIRVQVWPRAGHVPSGGSAMLSVNVQAEHQGAVDVKLEMRTWPGGEASHCGINATVSDEPTHITEQLTEAKQEDSTQNNPQ